VLKILLRRCSQNHHDVVLGPFLPEDSLLAMVEEARDAHALAELEVITAAYAYFLFTNDAP